MAQLTLKNGLSASIAYQYPHKGPTVPDAGVSDLATALQGSKEPL